MTKLLQWVLGVGSFTVVWLAYVAGLLKADVTSGMHQVILVLPLYLLMVFACYSLAVIGYRVTTFNDCVEASEELKQTPDLEVNHSVSALLEVIFVRYCNNSLWVNFALFILMHVIEAKKDLEAKGFKYASDWK